MRFALLSTTSFVALALFTYACSSSDPATPTADAGKTATSSSGGSGTSGSGDDDDDSTSGSSGTSGTSGNTSSSSGDGGGSSSSGDGGSSSSSSSSGSPVDGGTTAGTKCVSGDILEAEGDNGSKEKAQVIPTSNGVKKNGFCGRLTAGDTDFWTYTFNGANSYSSFASFSATVPTVTIIAGGQEFPFNKTFTKADPSPIKPGEPIVFKLTSATAVDYHIDFDVK